MDSIVFEHGLRSNKMEAPLFLMCDADLSMPVSEITRFLAVVPARCDIAIGTREGREREPHRRTSFSAM